MTAPLRWGILGTGMIAGKFASQLPETSRGTLAGVGSRSLESATRFCDEHGGLPHGSYASLVDDASIDAIYISLPNGLHREWSMRALDAGKHVLCEKPMALNHAEAVDMFDAAERCGRHLVEAFMYRCQPFIDEVLSLVRDGAVGEVRLIRTNFTYSRPISSTDARYVVEQGGGALMDVGCYCFNLARAITGAEPTSSHVVGHLHESGVDDWAAGTLTFPGDVLATFTCGMRVSSDHTTYICGSDGYIEVEFPWLGDGRFHIVGPDGRESRRVASSLPHYALEAERFAGVVQDGDAPWIPPADTLGNLALLDQLRSQLGTAIG
jgi:predicted dehydrogenase